MKKLALPLTPIYITAIFFLNSGLSAQQVTVNVNTLGVRKPVSPYIFGKNNSLSDQAVSSNDELTAADWQLLRDMGIQFFRENGGNNATKYNWRRKLSSHPDWYNNVYHHDWDYAAASLQSNIPSAQGMWAFQLIGKAAKSTSYNFNDWAYNQSQWWSGCRQNLCGGGQINTAGGEEALVDGDTSLYLEKWNADSTTGILDHWFGSEGVGLDSTKIRYWSMDNEPEIWNSTHDDVWPDLPSAEAFMQMYFDVAKKARAKYPGIKLTGPVPANEWQWYNWNGSKINYNGNDYVWLEYFILRIAEEQQASGIRLLDVIDIHFYPGETDPSDVLQLHRVFFDTTYSYPGANGVKRSGSEGWNNTLTKEYIFKRCNDWLTKYLGPDHGITFAVTETSLSDRSDPNINALWYASTLGEFAKQGVEIFTPWDWATGMSEAGHLFSHYGQEYNIPATSSEELYVSAYPTMNDDGDSLTIFLVNRHLSESRTVDLDISDFSIKDGSYTLYTLSDLPATETFVSHTSNALQQTTVEAADNNITVTLDPLSVSALIVNRQVTVYNKYGELLTTAEAEDGNLTGATISTSIPGYSGTGYVTGFDNEGDKITVSVSIPNRAIYRMVIRYAGSTESTHNVTINNSFTTTIDLASSGDFTYANAGGFVLNTGTNTITLSRNTGGADIDKIEVYRMEENTFQITSELVDTDATEETKVLYDFLRYQFGNRIISGQTHDYYSQVKTLTGKSPMLRGSDFQHFTQGYSYAWDYVNNCHTFGYHNDGSVDILIDWYNNSGKKGIISFQWHWHSPSGALSSDAGTNTFYTDYTTFDITQAVIPGTDEYNFVIRDIDSIASQLKKLQAAGIPVLWRPLHEAGGGWFWWGAKGPEACLALYDILFDRLKNYHQLHNLIWVWSTPEPEWYPGNDKVDIIGHDSYPGNYIYTNQKEDFDDLYMLTRGEKMIAMTENGPIPNPDACIDEDAPWLFFMSWSGLISEQNSETHIQEVYDNPVVLTLESTNAKTGFDWRSSLYPKNWKPGYQDDQGRFLHDFSYAGYHSGETDIPHITKNVIDITQPPYNADNTGAADVTSIIQQALDDAGTAGGGVVYLPAGTYQISTPEVNTYALKISHDSTILRGDGPSLTFLQHTQPNMRNKDIIHISGDNGTWFTPEGTTTFVTFDLMRPTRIIPVESTDGFSKGDEVIITSTPTDEFIAEHKMSGIWNAAAIKGVAFMRTIDSIDSRNNLLVMDAPTRYPLKTRDQARVYHTSAHLRECGIEDLSIGNFQNPNDGWDEESYTQSGTGAYEVHFSQVIHIKNTVNCWIKNIYTYRPAANTDDYHLLSNGVKLNQCRFITVDSCSFEKPQYKGGGGNGYMYTIESNDCLISNSLANDARHNFDFKYPYSNGNVILNCRGENSKYASDFHMYLSMSNLFDACTLNSDYLESAYRPYGGDALHGYTSTQSVFYNTTGEAYHPQKNYLIDSRQFGQGYVIGTSGPASEVKVDPAEGSINGYFYNTSPRDFTEGIGIGEYLIPPSLYLDQLERRMNDTTAGMQSFRVEITTKDAKTNLPIEDCTVQLYNQTVITDETGVAVFNDVLEFFTVSAGKSWYMPAENKQFLIYSDTTLTLYLTRKQYEVSIKLLRTNTLEPITYTSVLFGEQSDVTNSSGEVNFTAYGGESAYAINKAYYMPEEGTVMVNSDTTFVIYLFQTHANVRFRLRIGETPINNAMVICNNDTIISNSLGDALFKALPVSVTYPYFISKTGYEQQEGSVFVITDTIVIITMIPQTASDAIQDDDYTIYCLPNPVNHLLYVYMPDNQKGKSVNITNLNGIKIFSHETTANQLSINVAAFPTGTYILQVQTDNTLIVRYFIRE